MKNTPLLVLRLTMRSYSCDHRWHVTLVTKQVPTQSGQTCRLDRGRGMADLMSLVLVALGKSQVATKQPAQCHTCLPLCAEGIIAIHMTWLTSGCRCSDVVPE